MWARLPPKLNAHPHHRSSLIGRSIRQSLFGGSLMTAANDYASLTAGMYWWPGEVVHPRHLPAGSSKPNYSIAADGDGHKKTTVSTKPECSDSNAPSTANDHTLGLFPIRLFGLTRRDHRMFFPVYLWTTRARLFPYEEGDDKRGIDSR